MKVKNLLPFLLLVILVLTCACDKKQTDSSAEISENTDLVTKFDTELAKNNIDFEKIKLVNPEHNSDETYYYYLNDDSVFVLYVFDTNSETYKDIIKNGYISSSEGVVEQIEIEYNSGLVIEKNINTEAFDFVISSFNNVK